MTALLAPYLTRFSTAPPQPASTVRPETEPCSAVSPGELAARLAAAVDAAREEAERRHAVAVDALVAAQTADGDARLQAARAEWAAVEGESLAGRLDAGMADLRAYLADRVAAALRPLIAASLRDRLKDNVLETVDRLLADPGAPLLSVCGPADLLDALRAARPAPNIEWIAGDTIEVSIASGAARVEGRLAEALAALAGKEVEDGGRA